MAFYNPFTVEVHVLLVDCDMNDLLQTAKSLQDNSYRVTALQDIPSASSMLALSNARFDVVMLDTNSFSPEVFEFVHEAINKGLIVILMCVKADANQVKSAIEDGAFLVMEKPIAMEEMKNLWQHVLREKTRKSNKTSLGINIPNRLPTKDTTPVMSLNQNTSSMNKVTSQKGGVEFINFGSSCRDVGTCSTKPKTCMEWTPELHAKFVAATRQLGNGRCFPKDILEIMNVPGLTRMQVASHLQKCRIGVQPARHKKVSFQSPNSQISKPRKFGMSPFITESSQHAHQKNKNVEMFIPTTNGDAPDMGQQATPSSTSVGMNEIASSENMLGNIVFTPPQGPQVNIPIADDDFDLQQFDYDYNVTDVQQTCTGIASEEETGNPPNPWI